MLAWRGPFDPEAFSIEAINASLKGTFHRRAPAKKAAATAAADGDIDQTDQIHVDRPSGKADA
jgi:hypothetical protein